jgi:hypothetical protein
VFRSPLRPSPGRLRQLLPRLNGAYCIVFSARLSMGYFDFFFRAPKSRANPCKTRLKSTCHNRTMTDGRKRDRGRDRATAHQPHIAASGAFVAAFGTAWGAWTCPIGRQATNHRPHGLHVWPVSGGSGPSSDRQASGRRAGRTTGERTQGERPDGRSRRARLTDGGRKRNPTA